MCRIPSAFAVLAWIFVACIGRADDQPRTVRVLTYNIHHGEGTDGNFDLDRIARVIRAASPDLVALQEVDQKTKRSGGIDQLQKLAELTGLHPAYGRAMDYQGGAYGVAMLSRWPLKESRTHSLPSDPGVEPRVVLSAELTIGETGSNVHFLVTHVDHRADPTQRTMQLAKLREIFPAKPHQGLSILAGDFNATPDSEVMAALRTEWTDTAEKADFLTSPANLPRRKIDYVFCRPAPAWRVIETRALDESVASDHRPVLAVLELR